MGDSSMQAALTVGDAIPWVKLTVDYTDKIAALVPGDLYGWRSPDPSGAFSFSLGEILQHIVDARGMFIAQLSGDSDDSKAWSMGPTEPDYKTWTFREGSPAEIMDSLKESRALVNEWLDRPASAMFDSSDGTRSSWEKLKAQLEEQGDAEGLAKAEMRGPANVMRILMALAVHEAGHRGSLQTLIRQHGVTVDMGAE